ncbi:MAG: sulfurtransferase TusA family protein [Rhodospirillaceae bacterium]|jgi:tRNA 2-thiouridine synthesizing protein A|nr:sulfurtransferase TusA family protein [Rhodospirillaceae bacterium]MBT5945597.1 sulfurtransferase TusA family protein [Rhodospirillaceae bacterium]MBT6403823.1 sulfurtransferase TusA family protein [Rhodospirillaceae bacterium]MBT6536178.1 sulfurtransferase TusA family protein [Rhodospirillaceae bacterium]MBT7362561.1 sulfurtransferase TusA family protein [Rhodospirillaceae bacterium]
MQFDDEQTLDTSGLKCPLPVLKAKKVLKSMTSGATLRVIATDPGSVRDFAHFCDATGDSLLESSADDGVFTFRICKAGDA